MVNIPLNIVGVVTGIVGAITGISSLIWHIIKLRPRLRLERAYFVKGGFRSTNVRGHTHVGVRINLRNLGNRSVSVEKLRIAVGNFSQQPKLFKPITIQASSSEKLEYELIFPDEDFKNFFINGKLNFDVCIIHTFGRIIKSGKTDFWTGYYTIR